MGGVRQVERFRAELQLETFSQREVPENAQGRVDEAWSAQEVATFTKGLTQIGGEHFGSLVSATLLGDADAGERRQAAALGLELTPVSLQQLIIHLTSTTSHNKAREGV